MEGMDWIVETSRPESSSWTEDPFLLFLFLYFLLFFFSPFLFFSCVICHVVFLWKETNEKRMEEKEGKEEEETRQSTSQKKKERNEEDLFLQFKAPFFCFCGEVLADDG